MDSGSLKATKKEWLGLAVIALPRMLYSMDLTVLNLAVPKLTVDLNPSGAQLLWIVDSYGFLLATIVWVYHKKIIVQTNKCINSGLLLPQSSKGRI